jgi:hypothetical protein
VRKAYVFYISLGALAGAALLWRWHQQQLAETDHRAYAMGKAAGKLEFFLQCEGQN